MKSIAAFLVAAADLLEAEGRALRAGVARTAAGLAFVALAALVALAGFVLLVIALYLALAPQLGQAGAAACAGGGCLIIAGVLAWMVSRSAGAKR